ncbi:MAG TPA: alpha/beta hydrolase [Methylomirabilota bacterium]|nr:alpha/beta hydrolase [Methylomirabilota bacterium]
MAEIRHRSIRANGIRMHVAEAGDGFPVVMCHGWPELWYSWRHQLGALADAGFRGIAPDMRGYGETDAPADPAEYRTSVVCADILGLLDALGLERAVIVGHDWGGYHLWQFGLRHPERCAKLVGLNTPYAPPGPVPPTRALRERFGEDGYYMLWHQTPGRSEAELEADLRGNLAKVFKGFEHAGDLWTMATLGGGRGSLLGGVSAEGCFLTDEELDVYVRAFARTGTRGSFNWYRALDLNWKDARRIADPTIRVAALMITAENDPILRPAMAAPMPQWIPGIRIANIPRCSHWTQQERPAEVNRLLLDFIAELR